MSALFLFSRDFRLTDNKSLDRLYKLGVREVYPLFIFTCSQFEKDKNSYRSDNSLQLMIEGLKGLNQQTSGHLNLAFGKTKTVIKYLLSKNTDIQYLASNLDITPFGRKRDSELSKIAAELGKKYINEYDYNLLPLDLIKTKQGTFYKTFSHYKNNFFSFSDNISDNISDNLEDKINYLKVNDHKYKTNLVSMEGQIKINKDNIFLPFTREHFINVKLSDKNLDKFRDYEKFRKYPQYTTTLFSAYMKYGLVSCREVYQKIYNFYGKKETELLKQLIWREFYYYLMYHLPIKQTIGGMNMQMKTYKWPNNEEFVHAWRIGMTGFPFIDACMRQLNKTGWMHNRSRLCSANALVYLFKIDWRIGEKYFAEKLGDYDISQNNGNWQWCGGVGVDRKPYLRMYNPYSLPEKYDPDCKYIRKWVPELMELSDKDIIKYDNFLKKGGKVVGYPLPIVNYKTSREEAMIFFN